MEELEDGYYDEIFNFLESIYWIYGSGVIDRDLEMGSDYCELLDMEYFRN